MSEINLDDLNAETFQDLCGSIILEHFTPLAVPYGTPGKDGGIDAKHNGELIDYSTLFNSLHRVHHESGEDIYWVFQVKQIKREPELDRLKALKESFNLELFKWINDRCHEKGDTYPTCFILMTNVKLTPVPRKEIEEAGNGVFERFEIWDGAKIHGLVSISESLRRTFFPNKDDRIIERLDKLTKSFGSFESSTVTLTNTNGTTSVPSTSTAFLLSSDRPTIQGRYDFSLAVDRLVKYEIAFISQINTLAELFDLGEVESEETKDWERVEVLAEKKGILILKDNKEHLETVVQLIRMDNVKTFHWNRFVGEETEIDELIVSFKCHPDFVEELNKHKDSIFDIKEGENTAHEDVDSFLIQIQREILQAIDKRDYVVAGRLMSDFSRIRKNYFEKKESYPTAFYPNMRTFGGHAAFGWDFVTLWEKIYKDICDVIIGGNHPSDTIDSLLYIPFGQCNESILLKKPIQQFKANFSLVRRLFFILKESHNATYIEEYFKRFEYLCDDIHRSELKNMEDAEWALAVIKEVFDHLLSWVKNSLDGASEIEAHKTESFMHTITSMSFHGLLDGFDADSDWSVRFERQKEIHKILSRLKDEFYFAWGTYLWFKSRKSAEYNYNPIHDLIKRIKVEDLIDLYEKLKDKDSGWFGWWFNPESKGRVASWTSSIDHDIRDVLLAELLHRDFESEEILNLGLLESESSVKDFIKDLESTKSKLVGFKDADKKFKKTQREINLAMKKIEAKIQDRIAKTVDFSERKMRSIGESFTKKMKEHTLEGALYNVVEGIEEDKITHQVGTYSIHDKVWFIETDGHVSYAAQPFGNIWAENILKGREQLVVQYLKEKFDGVLEHVKLSDFLEELERDNERKCILVNHRTFPWTVANTHIRHEKTSEGANKTYVGNCRVIYSFKHVEVGKAIVLPLGCINWNIVGRLKSPEIKMIDADSDEGKKIKEKNPEMDIDQKVIINARELGFVNFSGPLRKIRFVEIIDVNGDEN